MKTQRIKLIKEEEIRESPYLLEVQKRSFFEFLQKDIPPQERKNQGLQRVLKDIFPITDYSGNLILEFVDYKFEEPKYSEKECKERDLTYAAPWYLTLRLIKKDTGEIKEQKIYMREFPMMTDRATFIFNGIERVVVSQIHRCPGVYFGYDKAEESYLAILIPYRGLWLEFELDRKNIFWARVVKRRKLPATVFLKLLGLEDSLEIISKFHNIREYDLFQEDIEKKIVGYKSAQEVKADDEKLLIKFLQTIEREDIKKLKENGIKKIKVIEVDAKSPIINTLLIDDSQTKNDAIKRIFSSIRPGEPLHMQLVKAYINLTFFDPLRFNIGEIGRYKINKKLNLNIDEQEKKLTIEDIIGILKYLIKLQKKEGEFDDIDHLANRRLRSVGELLENYLRIGFVRLAKLTREKLTIVDPDIATPQNVVNIKPVFSVIQEFFGTNPLSQFLDQTNPIAELTHKRRISALGHGGLSRERAGFEVRDVYPSHYGKLCPIETPEGPNIGLITSLALYARINKYGIIETPYRKVKNGKVTNQIVYVPADEEDKYKIISADIKIGEDGSLPQRQVIARYNQKYILLDARQADFIDLSKNQLFSVTTSLIPFLEHDDANRALMGSNMQRQAVPLMLTEPPIVATGLEKKVVKDCGVDIISDVEGEVIRVTADELVIKTKDNKEKIYQFKKWWRSNQDTVIHQKPLVKKHDKVKVGDVLTYGTATSEGELALGKNVLVAIMPWEGYNFEDAIVISERLVKDDVFTSIHIEKFELKARETQMGVESITRDIITIPEEYLGHLDENGIVMEGVYVNPGDVIIGRVSPVAESALSPEYKLLQSIFGEKVKDVKDTSLWLSHGSKGVVIKTEYYSTQKGDKLPVGVNELAKVHVALKRKIKVGDKLSGRHGNKGVVSKILKEEDMPFLEDGTVVDIILNPHSIPSRMNLGQILEALLGLVGYKANLRFESPSFNGATLDEIKDYLKKYNLPQDGGFWLYDGRTGERFRQKVVVGYMYIMKLIHLVEDKIHARSVGPYSLITQQPLGGKAHFGGQRLGEMEVWALEAYGASHLLQEFLTVKSDDVVGRVKVYEALVKGEDIEAGSFPESFNVMLKELKALALDVKIYDEKGNIIDLTKIEKDRTIDRKYIPPVYRKKK